MKQRNLLAAAAFFLVLAGAAALAGHFQGAASSGERSAAAAAGALAAHVSAAFAEFQNATLRDVERIAALPDLPASLTGDRARLFDRLLAESPPGLTLEAFDAHGALIAWTGTRGASPGRGLFRSAPASAVLQGPIYSYLAVVVPVGQAGYLAGKRLFDVRYPINNRFLGSRTFRAAFSSSLGVDAEFDFTGDVAARSDSATLSIPLNSLDGSLGGYAYVARPLASLRLEEERLALNTAGMIALMLASIALAAIAARRIAGIARPSLRAAFGIALLWAFRYFLILLSIPARFSLGDLLDPHVFASPFGGGLATSLGELLLTSLTLAASIGVAARAWFSSAKRARGWTVMGVGGAVLLLFGTLLALRGFAALVRSAVFDSALSYADPTTVMPSAALGVMLISLLAASLALVGGSAIMLSAAAELLGAPSRRAGAAALVLLTAAGSVLFGLLQPSPLMGQLPRLLALGVLGGTAWIAARGEGRLTLGSGAALFAAAVLLLMPALDESVHMREKARVEFLAAGLARPEDTWLRSIVTTALDELAGPETAKLFTSGDPSDLDKIAFTHWATSILAREGNNCSVVYADSTGAVVSDFRIGLIPGVPRGRTMENVPAAARIHGGERVVNGESVRWYAGEAPVTTADGVTVGSVAVEIFGGREALLRGERSDILRNAGRGDPGERVPILSEYAQGRLVFSTNEAFPLDRTLPASVGGEGGWLQEAIEGTQYESYYVPAGADRWTALSLEPLGLRWHFYTFTRTLLFYMLCALAAGGGILLVRLARGTPPRLTVRGRLFGAFAVVSLIPVVILAYYNRQYTGERMVDSTERRLSSQTSAVLADVLRRIGAAAPVALRQLTDEGCSAIANDLNTDFNVYEGTTLLASSKPEIFDAEILDTRLSARAYVNLAFRKKAFFAEEESIGSLPYVVGYRPVTAENGAVIGAVAVPTIYSQGDAEEALARRNVFLYGAYAVALVFALVAGTLFAGTISAPIQRLRRATEELSRGGLDVALRSRQRPGDELSELEESFRRMTVNLRMARAEMARTERETAWKEMARQVAHEIKNPLMPMKLSIQHLARAYQDGAQDFGAILRQVADIVLGQIEALSRIASAFSAYARMPERKLQPCDLHEIARDAADLFRQHQTIAFTTSFAAARTTLLADRDELRRALINILRNAVQALNERGAIALATRNEGEDIVLTIRDDGPGISDEVKRRLFEPSFSTKTDGMGLGLALVKQTITDLKGEIRIESLPGMGTEVVIRLPLAAPEESGARVGGDTAETGTGASRS